MCHLRKFIPTRKSRRTRLSKSFGLPLRLMRYISIGTWTPRRCKASNHAARCPRASQLTGENPSPDHVSVPVLLRARSQLLQLDWHLGLNANGRESWQLKSQALDGCYRAPEPRDYEVLWFRMRPLYMQGLFGIMVDTVVCKTQYFCYKPYFHTQPTLNDSGCSPE
ncbi:uncharacterized protein BDW70DRAFT_23083 [Aspergillus foveolatus]|uniref:uncharacterized protein n=1 Tax=Aspergillus foveolatus TaxID=210207 RepID=UPI003CCCE31F